LGRRGHSRKELAQKLVQRGFGPADIEAALSECTRLQYLNDEGYCQIYTQQLRRKGYGARRIGQALHAKGVAPELIEMAIRKCCNDAQQLADCHQALAKWRRKGQRPTTTDSSGAIYRFLLSRGFSSDIIQQALGRSVQEEI
jgi:regulatory protein